jgi:hypothetical protein
VGVNVWRALRDINEAHPAWEHLGGVPVTEADLPVPLRVAQGEDSHAEVVKAFNAMAPAAARNGGSHTSTPEVCTT